MTNSNGEVFDKTELSGCDYVSLYKKGMIFFNRCDYRNAEFWLEAAVRHPEIPPQKKAYLKKFLNRREFNELYNSCACVPYRASHMTTGGNYSSGSWSPWRCVF